VIGESVDKNHLVGGTNPKQHDCRSRLPYFGSPAEKGGSSISDTDEIDFLKQQKYSNPLRKIVPLKVALLVSMADDIAEVVAFPGHDFNSAPEPQTDTVQALRTPHNYSSKVLGAKADLEPRATTEINNSTLNHRLLWKPPPDLKKADKRGRREDPFWPRPAHCARVPKCLNFELHFDEVPSFDGTVMRNYSVEFRDGEEPDAKHLYLVIGIFSGVEARPRERVVLIGNRAHLFRTLRWNYVLLRGLRFLFSLKDVKRLRLYEVSQVDRSFRAWFNKKQCNWLIGTHTRIIEVDYQVETTLYQLWGAFNKFWTSYAENRVWAAWIHENLNSSSYQPDHPPAARIAEMSYFDEACTWQPRNHQQHDKDCALTLELVLGWSATRISIAVSIPVILSMVIGFWYQKATGDVATAWVLGTYVVTSAGSRSISSLKCVEI
jgi:hypothetical protein